MTTYWKTRSAAEYAAKKMAKRIADSDRRNVYGIYGGKIPVSQAKLNVIKVTSPSGKVRYSYIAKRK